MQAVAPLEDSLAGLPHLGYKQGACLRVACRQEDLPYHLEGAFLVELHREVASQEVHRQGAASFHQQEELLEGVRLVRQADLALRNLLALAEEHTEELVHQLLRHLQAEECLS